jgi:transposase InsO family protein
MSNITDDKLVVPLLSSGISYPEWHQELKSALGYKKVWGHCQRWDDDKEPKKPKPTKATTETKEEYRKRLEEWEQSAELALSILRKALGDYKGSIQNIDNPLDAYEKVKKLYSAETEYDIINLMTQFCELEPVGHAVPQYIASMVRIQSNLKALEITYNDTQVIGTALTKLRKYPEGSPWNKMYRDLSFKFKDKPKEVDMIYFERFVHQTLRDIESEEMKKEIEKKDSVVSEEEDAAFVARALKAGFVKRSNNTTRKDPYCNFCKKRGHWYENCDDPNFDPNYGNGKSNSALDKGDPKKKGRERGRDNKADVVKSNEDDESDGKWCIQSSVLAVMNQSHTLPNRFTAYLDSGSSRHIICNPTLFEQATNTRSMSSYVTVGNGDRVKVEAKGDVVLIVVQGEDVVTMSLKECLLVPEICANLISVSQLTEGKCQVQFDQKGATIKQKSGDDVHITKTERLYPLNLIPPSDKALTCSTGELWHMRLGHFSNRSLKSLSEHTGCVPGVDRCEPCAEGMSQMNHFPRSQSQTHDILDTLQTDLSGPFCKSLNNGRYFMVIVDDFSRYYEVYILKHKSEALKFMQRFVQLHETRTGKKVKCIRSDNGGEFLNKNWTEWLREKGIKRELTSPYSPPQNGRAERAVGVLKTGATKLLRQAKLPQRFWSSAVCTFAYTRNKIPLAADPNHIPERLFLGKEINYTHLRVFGCVAWCHIPKERRHALEPKAIKCIMIGYGQQDEKGVKGYVLWNPRKRERIITANVKFWEERTYDDAPSERVEDPFAEEAVPDEGEDERSNRIEPMIARFPVDEPEARVEEIEEDEPQFAPNDNHPAPAPLPEPALPPPRQARNREPPRHLADYDVYLASDEHQVPLEELLDELSTVAFYSKSGVGYDAARQGEVQSMIEHDVWELVPYVGQKLISNQFLYSEKMDSEGDFFKKARLIVHGNRQTPGEDYNITEIFAPVVKLESLRILLAYAVMEGLPLLQGDVKTAYLNSPLKEDVYMRQPKDFEVPGKKKFVCKLKKSMYGLHQSARNWYVTMCDILALIGYVPLVSEPSLFIKRDSNGKTVGVLALYVDDLVLAGTTRILQELQRHLDSNLKMKWNQNPKLLLGLQLEHEPAAGTLRLSQTRYIDEILEDCGLSNCTPTKTPIYQQFPFDPEQQKQPDRRFPYLECIGKLNWLARGTRPDIAYAVSHLSRFCSSYQETHWNACLHLLKYLKGTRAAYLEYRREGSAEPVGYSDSDWAQNKGDRKSVTGFMFNMANAPITWSSKGQSTIALSSTEAEYVALTATAREALWLRSVLTELGKHPTSPTTIYEDNESAAKLVNNPVLHSRSKHIDICHHAIRQFVKDSKIRVERKPTDTMLADMLTKPLSGRRIQYLAGMSGLRLNVQR